MANAYDAILNQYKNDTTPAKTKRSGSVDLNRYFSAYLPKGVNSATKTIRILPATVEGDSPFVTMHVHSMNVGGTWTKIICPEKEDEGECPICEAKRLLYDEGTEAAAEQAKKYNTRKMYVIRVIDRSDEEAGPKWFRFWHNGKQEGVMDQIASLMQTYKTDVTDEKNGMDLILNIKRDSVNTKVCKVVSILPGDKGALYSDETVASAWVNSGETWRDVYSVKPYEYLKIVAVNKTPIWSKEAKGFVAKEDEEIYSDKTESFSNDEIIMGEANPVQSENSDVKEPTNVTSNSSEEDDDLPF
jgi:hypothetical protein